MANPKHSVATLTLKLQPQKKERAWLLTFENDQYAWFPFSTITAFDPNSLKVNVQCWILKQKGIRYKV